MPKKESQRRYTAPCPGCGAPVEFQSAQSTHAICSYCRSTVVRSGEVLSRVGTMAELFEDYSPLQLRATGHWRGQAFSLIGRLQFHGDEGAWTEWVALLADGGYATLSEDNGAYVFTQPRTLAANVTIAPAQDFRVGEAVTFAGGRWTVASKVRAHLSAAEGELPELPPPGRPFDVVELRNEDGVVLSIGYGSDPPQVDVGRAVQLADLQLKGLKDESAKHDQRAREFDCPHCGAPVAVRLEMSKSVTCGSCRSVIDLTRGIGHEIVSSTQDERSRPLIALGSVGTFEGQPWQVVGYQQRVGQEPGDDEQFTWQEYLLYNQQKGFVFLVDASDGWSLVRPATGAPKVSALVKARYLGVDYMRTSGYSAETAYVEGEFYWPVVRGQRTQNDDYAAVNGKGLLSCEKSGKEVSWSYGSRLASLVVAKAFGREEEADRFKRDEVGPFAASGGAGCGTVIFVIVMLVIVLFLLGTCSSSGGSYSRTGGGSFGGFSSGGSHK